MGRFEGGRPVNDAGFPTISCTILSAVLDARTSGQAFNSASHKSVIPLIIGVPQGTQKT